MAEFRIYRKLDPGEFIIATADTSQGGGDWNCCTFMSYQKLDIPIVYWNDGVAATMTPDIHRALNFISELTGVPPIVAFERNNGGSSELERLRVLNRTERYLIYVMKDRKAKVDKEDDEESKDLGWKTSAATRPYLLGEYKEQIDSHVITFYDQQLLDHHKTFIKGKGGKPQASKGTHDDGVIAPSIGWQLYQTEEPQESQQVISQRTEKARDAARAVINQMRSR